MEEMIRRLSLGVDDAIMVDSTDPDVIEAALALIPGRAIVNSINLEDGGEKANADNSYSQTFWRDARGAYDR